jgi:uncharacterized protein YecE (DUF72 family)
MTMSARPESVSSTLDDLFIGCSGWQYRHWRGNFYPPALPLRLWLSHYTETFDTVEVNNSFYRLPDPSTFERWRESTPVRFRFAVKASRFLTHMKKLKEPEAPIDRLFARADYLRQKLGPMLYQLPPRWPLDLDRLEHFLAALPRSRQHVIEVRNPSWYAPRVFELLDAHGVALCLHDMAGSASGRPAVGPFSYLRFHGPARYQGSYGDAALESWAAFIVERLQRGPVYAYFNNDIGGHAPRDAVRLRHLVRRIAHA